MVSLDQYNCLRGACQDAARYPANAIRTHHFPHTLKEYEKRLSKRNEDLFQADSPYPIVFLEAYDGEDFQEWECDTVKNLQRHLWCDSKDPRYRHVFIQAETSIWPLDCSKETFLLLLSFHQVMPRFLDLIFAFGRQPSPPPNLHYTAFHHENFLDSQTAHDYEIPKLGRSGRQIRHCYNLWAVEKSDYDGKWTFRQTAVYHSFDIDSGRAFWINVKANELMRERITEVETMPGNRKAGGQPSSNPGFGSTLTTHFILFEWCCENWREYLGSLEQEIREILTKAKNAPLAEVETKLAVDFEALIAPPPGVPLSPSRRSTLPRARTFSTQSTMADSPISPKRVLSGLTATSAASRPSPTGHPIQPGENSLATLVAQPPPDQFRVFKEFSVKSLQRLGGIGSQLQEAALAMKVDAEVLDGVATHYVGLMGTAEFPDSLKTAHKKDVESFKEKADGYIRYLESEQARITTLMKSLEDGNKLFDMILQFRNMEINKLFAVNAQESAARMEGMTVDMHTSTLRMEKMTSDMGHIAEKTERETASMHIITLVTLVFLPATFVSTIFGSGLFQWDQNNPGMAFPVWKQEYFNLFAQICFPMMIGVILIWYILYVWAKRRDRLAKVRRDEEAQLYPGGEKASLRAE